LTEGLAGTWFGIKLHSIDLELSARTQHALWVGCCWPNSELWSCINTSFLDSFGINQETNSIYSIIHESLPIHEAGYSSALHYGVSYSNSILLRYLRVVIINCIPTTGMIPDYIFGHYQSLLCIGTCYSHWYTYRTKAIIELSFNNNNSLKYLELFRHRDSP